MSVANHAWSFWRTISEVSPRIIREEMTREYRLGIVGKEAERTRWRGLLLPEHATRLEQEDGGARLLELELAPDEGTAAGCVAIFYLGAEGEAIGVRGPNSLPFVGTDRQALEWVTRVKPDLGVAFGRYLPGMRPVACQRLILRASETNARFAFLSALPGVLPITLPFLPASSAMDVIVLTKNQAMLVMRLAAAHGHAPGYTKQVREVLGTVAGAMGWRLLAREIVGMIPAGVGVAAKTAIAYSGTVTVGKAALYYYQHGRQMTAEQIRQVHAETQVQARTEAERVSLDPPTPEEIPEL